ncbi:MAG: hypothetical protein HKO66_08885 [Saprospiraceae bacterium]|nr:ester cyclase [Bacteroidia bacterium]NNE16754.1 hypothetical protein [Saprospiraceae bacterium]NNL92331.1 hypothetical protein [Saprospiraceae bacterium]
MNQLHPVLKKWFLIWQNGNFEDIPISKDFKHTSPFGVIDSAAEYLEIVHSNKEAFLNHKFENFEQISEGNKVCIRYNQISEKGTMRVCEWYILQDDLIKEVYSYYNIGNASLVKPN